MEISSPEVPSRKTCKIKTKLVRIVLCFVVAFLFFVVLFTWCSTENPQGPLIQTKLGAIRGHYLTSYKGNQYEAYEGIPFAQPPIGQRRFQSPVPIGPWSNELQATKVKAKCLQSLLGQSNETIAGTEDCLYLNVYLPVKKKANGTLPVIFYLHGGFFRVGGPRVAEEQYIVDYDVIFVSTQFRLGALGFLSTEDDVVPGNMGLKDQSMALRWIYDNIESFGGDPKRITLAGGSTGAACVHMHYFSAWSRGLFQAGMSLSGTAFTPWALVKHPREKAIALGHALNCSQEDMKRMVECIRAVPGDILAATQNKLQTWWNVNYGVFGPVIEKSNRSVDPFIDDYPSRILEEGRAYDVPWIVGSVSAEGLSTIESSATAYTSGIFKYVNEHWDTLAPVILDYTYTIPKEQHAKVARRIRKHYLGDKPINHENVQALTHLFGDRLYIVGAINAAKVQATGNKSPVFMYYYTYRATDSISNKYSNSTEDLGACHGDDCHLIVKLPGYNPEKSDKDIAMQKLLIKMWTSVAYNGIPDIGVKWPRVTLKNKTCLDYVHLAGPGNYKVECSDTLGDNKFWNSIGFDEK